MTRGIWYGVAAYAIWGTFPLYWRLLRHIAPLQVLGHRIVWSFLLLAAILLTLRKHREVLAAATPRIITLYAVAAVLIAINWYLFIYAVAIGRVLETSLGYFITPLVNVVLGVAILRERLRPLQWIAVALAAAGVVSLTHAYGALPSIALGLAASFGGYGLAKKKAPLGPMDGLTLETAVLFVPAVACVVLTMPDVQTGAFFGYDAWTYALMMGGGFITTLPLLLFAASVRRVPLSVVGLLQYISPSIQFILGVFVLHEPFSAAQLAGFGFVWAAVIVFSIHGLFARRVAMPVPLDEGAA
jgi:chloramphenicol-sensitive protein RarD